MTVLHFFVPGKPIPQGSMRAFVGAERMRYVPDNPNMRPWRNALGWEAMREMRGAPLEEGPVSIIAKFYFVKPKSAPKKRIDHTFKPDIDKLARALLDALTGVVYRDDSQVVCLYTTKAYTDSEHPTEGLEVWIT